MFIMKKLFLIPIFILALFSFSSCEEDHLNPLPEKVIGQYMKLDIKTREIDIRDMETAAFTGTLSNPSGDVVKYDLFVRRRTGGFLTGDYVLLQTITSFPHELRITPQMLADALSVNVSDLLNTDVFAFFAYSYDAEGNKAGYLNLARIIQITPAMEQGYRFNTALTDNPTALDAEIPYNNYLVAP